MTVSIQQPFVSIPDTDGEELKNGYVYIGTTGLNPETNLLTVYWDAGLTIPAAQPLRTINGFFSRNGSPGNIFVSESDYSITVRDKNKNLVYTSLSNQFKIDVNNVNGAVITHVNVAAMKADTNLQPNMLVRTLGYTTADDDGGALYVIKASAAVDGYGSHTLDNGNIAAIQHDGFILLEQYGASESNSDNTANIQAAIDVAEAVGEGRITSVREDRFTIETPLTIGGPMEFYGTKLLTKFAGNPDYAIQVQGTLGSSTALTATMNPGDTVVPVTSSSGFTVGGYLIIKDTTRLSNRWPYTISQILDITGNNITIAHPVGVEYLLANTPTAEPLDPVSGVHIHGLDIKYDIANSSTSKFVVQIDKTVDCSFTNSVITDHAYTSNPTAAVSVRVDGSLRCNVDNIKVSHDENTVGGNATLMYGCTDSRQTRITSTETNFGLGLWLSYGCYVSENYISGRAASGNRGIKMAGCQQSRVENNTVNHFDSGIKVEDSGMFIVASNAVSSCGVSATSYGINISHISAASSADIRPCSVVNNNVFNQTGWGVILDSNTFQCIVDGNVVRDPSAGGYLVQGQYNTISNNFAYNWASEQGFLFAKNNIVVGNNAISTSTSLGSYQLSALPDATDWSVFTNNASQNNAIVNNPSYFQNVAVCNGNAIKDYGNRIMFRSAVPTSGAFTRGDRVYSTTPTAGGKIGWVCTASGTPGTWKAFGAIDP